MIIATSENIPGKEYEILGLVKGNTVRAKHLGHDVLANLKNLVGGEIGSYSKLMTEARDQALENMKKEAEELGADAIVMTRFTTSAISNQAAEVLVYGTGVRLR